MLNIRPTDVIIGAVLITNYYHFNYGDIYVCVCDKLIHVSVLIKIHLKIFVSTSFLLFIITKSIT